MKIKKEAGEALLFFRVGDFYETFFEDAKLASRVLGITLTSRGTHLSQKIPLAGVPYHAAPNYISRLVRAGYKVAICDQVEDPKLAKGIVKRSVTRIVTPGTALDDAILDNKANNYLAAVNVQANSVGLAFVDISTGEFKVTELKNLDNLLNELGRLAPAECLIPESLLDKNTQPQTNKTQSSGTGTNNSLASKIKLYSSCSLTAYDDWLFSFETAKEELITHFQIHSLDGLGCAGLKAGTGSAGAIIHYLKQTQKNSLAHINTLKPYIQSESMHLDAATQRNLELVRPMSEINPQPNLLSVLDLTLTSMGARMLRNWITHPLLDINRIQQRLDTVEALLEAGLDRDSLREQLKGIADLERMLSRLNCGQGNARDLVSLKESLKRIPVIKQSLAGIEAELIKNITTDLDELADVVELIDEVIVDEPPFLLREGGLIKTGYNKALDELRAISSQGKGGIGKLQQQERERTGINSLKVGYNRVFGYYIEVTKANLNSVPEDYIRKQTLVNAERFITPDLKDYESQVLTAQEKIRQLEYSLFLKIKDAVTLQNRRIQKTAVCLGCLDAVAGLAQTAAVNGYIKPEVDQSQVINIVDGRHPVLEKVIEGERFVPNDTLLDSEENQLLIITGPNMAGKSTYLRQVALLVLMTQAGSFIPAKKARIGVVDRIFTRVGAQDELARGRSTFMVEMNETANILNNATNRSLIVLDEIGRGTSTFDGVSIAWAVAEYIHNHPNLGAKTIFATHYHELTELELTLPGVKNYNVSVKEWDDKIIFLRKIIPGGTDKSYGIHVARLAGLPKEIIQRAKEILSTLEIATLAADGKPKFAQGAKKLSKTDQDQLSFFSSEYHPVVDELRNMDMDNITPLDALNKLQELKKKSKD